MKSLYYQTIAELAPKIEGKEISPVELTQAILQRVETVNPVLNAYITLLTEQSLNQAKNAENEIMAGHYRGALHGIPIALKDLFYTKGIRTTSGSAIDRDFVPNYNATVFGKLEKSGAILTGKLNMHEYAFGATNINEHYGNTCNPWNKDHITGGSSGGSGAAVAAGLCVAALGTDTGGSIRTPSSLCGTVGLKPTFGRVSKYGVTPLAWSLDHVGPLTRSVEDAAIMLEAIAGFDSLDPTTVNRHVDSYRSGLSLDVKGVKVGVPLHYFFDDIDAEVKEKVELAIQTLQSLGAEIVEVPLPELSLSMFAEMVTISAEASAYHHDTLMNNSKAYGSDVRILLEGGELLTAVQYVKAQQARRIIKEAFEKAFKKVDVMVAPTLSITAPQHHQSQVEVNGEMKDAVMEFVKMAAPCNLAGLPSLSIPVGLSDARLPIGMQIIGKPFAEKTVLQVGAAYERVVPFQEPIA